MNCPLCGHSSVHYHYFLRKGSKFNVNKCIHCHSLFQNPMPANTAKLYGKKYYAGEQEYSYHDERESFEADNIVWKARLKNIRKYIPSGRFLDVGCSFGGFVQSASQYFKSTGLDISKYVVIKGNEWAKKRGYLTQNKNFLGLFKGDLNQLPKNNIFSPNSMDVISLVEVAEHLTDPIGSFKNAYKLLKDNGLLLIQTANFEGWQAKREGKSYHYFLPGHFLYYTASGLKNLLERIGFQFFLEFFPLDFPLWPKLMKSKYQFKSLKEYYRWVSIAKYHLASKIRYRGFPLTSSYVLYAFKNSHALKR